MNSDPDNDRADLDALKQGDDSALNRLIARWERPLLAFAWRYLQNNADARDVVAELFVRLYHHRLNLRPDTRLGAWLFTTLSNLCHNHHRWRRRHQTVSLHEPQQGDSSNPIEGTIAAESPTPSGNLERSEAMKALADAIERLPHDLKTTLLLHHYEKMPYREIGGITGCSERGVETRLYRAKQRLRAELGKFLAEITPR